MSDYKKSVEIPWGKEGRTYSVSGIVNYSSDFFTPFNDRVSCVWLTNMPQNTSYGNQCKLVGYLCSFDSASIIKYLESSAAETGEEVMMALCSLIREKYGNDFSDDLNSYIDETLSSFDSSATIGMK